MVLRKDILTSQNKNEAILEISFLIFSNIDLQFAEKKLVLGTNTSTDVQPTTQKVEIIDQKDFAKTVLNKDFEAFVVYMNSASP